MAVSPDLPKNLQPTVARHELGYRLLSDATMTAARAYGIAYRVDDKTVGQYKGYGIDLEAVSGQDHHLLPVPAVFIHDGKGQLAFSYVNPDYKVRLAPAVLLAAAKAAIAK